MFSRRLYLTIRYLLFLRSSSISPAYLCTQVKNETYYAFNDQWPSDLRDGHSHTNGVPCMVPATRHHPYRLSPPNVSAIRLLLPCRVFTFSFSPVVFSPFFGFFGEAAAEFVCVAEIVYIEIGREKSMGLCERSCQSTNTFFLLFLAAYPRHP